MSLDIDDEEIDTDDDDDINSLNNEQSWHSWQLLSKVKVKQFLL